MHNTYSYKIFVCALGIYCILVTVVLKRRSEMHEIHVPMKPAQQHGEISRPRSISNVEKSTSPQPGEQRSGETTQSSNPPEQFSNSKENEDSDREDSNVEDRESMEQPMPYLQKQSSHPVHNTRNEDPSPVAKSLFSEAGSSNSEWQKLLSAEVHLSSGKQESTRTVGDRNKGNTSSEMQTPNPTGTVSGISKLKSQADKRSSFHTISERVMYAYSAYYDNRQPHLHPFGLVRVFSLYHVAHVTPNSSLQCQLHYKREGGVRSSMISSGYLEDLEGHERAMVFVRNPQCSFVWRVGAVICKNRGKKVPDWVTIEIQNQTMTNHRVPVSNIHTQLGKQKKQDLGICISNVFKFEPKDKGFILQSLDMKFAMGANAIFIYGTSGSAREIQELLSRLNSSSVRMMDYNLPDEIGPGFDIGGERKEGSKQLSRYNGQTLQFIDCQYRNMYLYKYLAVIDLDEFAYPMDPSMNTVALLDKISAKNNHQVAFFVFFDYKSCYAYDDFQGFKLRRWGFDGKMFGELWGGNKFKFKTIHRPEFVVYCRTHNCWEPIKGTFGLTVSPAQAVCYHFRNQCPTENKYPQNNWTSEIRHRHDVINDYLRGLKKHLAIK